tara:strand:+ start:213 stop:1970 length:1758 start_codon:yes stop_codon:yes gene_type:complete
MANEEKVLISVVVDDKKANKSLETVTKKTKDTGNAAKDAAADFSIMGVSLNSIKGAFSKIIPIAKAMFTTIKAGLISTGIGAIVVAVGALITHFTQTKKGAEALSVAFKTVGAAISVITDRISAIGGAIIKVFKGDFKGAAEDAKNAVKGIGDEIRKETKAAIDLGKAFNALKDSNRALNVETAARRSEIEALKLIAEDLTNSEEERLEAAEKAFNIENDLLDKRVANAEEALRIKKEENALGESMAEDLDEQAQLEIDLFNIKQESITKQIELNNKINGIKREAEAKEKAALQEIADKKREVLLADLDLAKRGRDIREQLLLEGIENEEKRELKALELKFKRLEEEVDRSGASAERIEIMQKQLFDQQINERKKIKARFREEEKQAQEEETKQNKANLAQQEADFRALQDTKISAMNTGLSAMADAFGRETAAGKAAAVAQATMNTYTGATRALKDFPVPFNFVAMAGIITSGLLQVKKIVDTPKPAKMNTGGLVGGIGTGTSDSVNARLSKGESVINARSTRMFKPLLSAINEAGGGSAFADKSSISTQSQGITGGVVKAFVVADEMSNTQDRLTKIRRRATI